MASRPRYASSFRASSRLRVRLVARDGRPAVKYILPVIGPDDQISPSFDDSLANAAIAAQAGDREARNSLYAAFYPKLHRLSLGIYPPAATLRTVGIWDRNDVDQEMFLVFTDLLDAWPGDVSLTAWMLSRFVWRLRDVFLRGIGRPSVPRSFDTVDMASVGEDVIDPAELDPATMDPDALRILDALPPRLQTALLLAAGGMSQTAVAQEMGVSRRTIVRYWTQMREIARDILGHEEP